MSFGHFPSIHVSLDNLVHNLKEIKRSVSTRNIIAIVKDNAYGCGAAPIARVLEEEGVGCFAVARTDEAKELRVNHVTSPILILGSCNPDEMVWAANHNVHLSINEYDTLSAIIQSDVSAQVHVNVNTGMNRLGINLHEVNEVIALLKRSTRVKLTGLYTHFASADVPCTDSVGNQYELFLKARQLFLDAGFTPQYTHAPNSAGLLRFGIPEGFFVRPGIVLYGCKPDPNQEFNIDLRQIISLKAPVIRISQVSAQTPISYGGTYITPSATCIATIPFGYAHGVPRALSNNGFVLIGGKRFPIVGRVTMDYVMVDIGAQSSIRKGDEAVIFGSQQTEQILVDEVASRCGTISYEILLRLSNRIDRYFFRNDTIVCHQQGILF